VVALNTCKTVYEMGCLAKMYLAEEVVEGEVDSAHTHGLSSGPPARGEVEVGLAGDIDRNLQVYHTVHSSQRHYRGGRSVAAEEVERTIHIPRHSAEADMEHSVVDNGHIDAEAGVGDVEEARTMGTEYDMVVVVVVVQHVSDALTGVEVLGSGEGVDVEGGGGLAGGDVGAEAVARTHAGVVVAEVDSQGQTVGEGRWLWNVYRTSWTGPRVPKQDRSPIPQYLSEAG
jgi:hypothetical protein